MRTYIFLFVLSVVIFTLFDGCSEHKTIEKYCRKEIYGVDKDSHHYKNKGHVKRVMAYKQLSMYTFQSSSKRLRGIPHSGWPSHKYVLLTKDEKRQLIDFETLNRAIDEFNMFTNGFIIPDSTKKKFLKILDDVYIYNKKLRI